MHSLRLCSHPSDGDPSVFHVCKINLWQSEGIRDFQISRSWDPALTRR